MPGRIFIGCPMWANRSWVGSFFPASTRVGDELAQYSNWCTAVEGNTTFYALPPIETVRRWRDATPESFRFVFKLPRTITHERRLRDTDAELTKFLRVLEPLGPRCGPVTAQLPPTFGPGDVGVLAAFLRRAPSSFRWAIEVRHPDFFSGGRAHDNLDRLLIDVGAERVILDTRTLFSAPPSNDEERESWSKKPQLAVIPQALTATPIVRFVGRMDEVVTRLGWQGWLPVLAQWAQEGRTPIVFVHTPDDFSSLPLARQLYDDLAATGCVLEPLPEIPVRQAIQRSLFD